MSELDYEKLGFKHGETGNFSAKNFDYENIGFKAGIEIHQQLDTKKLFCNCPSILRQDEPDFIVKRRLHSVAGESGEVDIAAKHEAEKDKTFTYEGYDTTCLVELDEMPPYEINKEALGIALHVATFLNARILPITQIMRKTVIDGSNTSGFQRSVLIAYDGWIVTKAGRVGIQSICLEEDAARIVNRDGNSAVYRLDRLGIPLIEIATSPDMKDPEQVKEVALYIGKILRSCKIKRGIGTIRQDINLSIKNGERVEIKGFQDPAMMVQTINNEIRRHADILKTGKRPGGDVRNALSDGTTEFLRPLPGADRMYPETDLPLLKISRSMIDNAKKNLPKLRDEIEKELEQSGLNQEMIKLVLEGYLDDFKHLLEFYPIDPQLVAKMLTIWRSELATKLKKNIEEVNEVINLDILEKILKEVEKGKIAKGDIRAMFNELISGVPFLQIEKKEKKSENAEEKILHIIKANTGLSENAYMGLVMKELKGLVNGKEAMEIIKKIVK